jgi:hypothetical protein
MRRQSCARWCRPSTPRDHETYKHGLSDRLLLVLLDEMNLAHVEQYFSDLLSRLEQRRGESRDVTLDIDLGAGMPPYPLRLGRNVLWVGTMNEDETTKALSDKVIDRSNLLYFPRPRELHSRTDVTLGAESPLLAESAWREWLAASFAVHVGRGQAVQGGAPGDQLAARIRRAAPSVTACGSRSSTTWRTTPR